MPEIYTPTPDPTGTAEFQAYGLDDLSSGSGLGTAFTEGFQAPGGVAGIARSADLEDAREGRMAGVGGRWGYRQKPDTPILSKDEANAKYGVEGLLSFDQDIREGEAKLIRQYKIEDQQRQSILARSDPSVTMSALRLGAQFAGAAVDPINVASSFIPVVGEAKFAAMAGRVGLTSARLVRGGLEGAVGSALVEPLAYFQSQNEHSDYTAYDSMRNIVFGTFLGAGLHAGFGKLSDFINRQPAEVKQAALQGALAAFMEDRPVTVADVFRFEQSRKAMLTGSTALSRTTEISPTVAPVTHAAELSAKQEQRLPLADNLGRPVVYETKSQADKAAKLLKAEGYVVEPVANGFRLAKTATVEIRDTYPERFAAESAIKRLPPSEREGLEVVRTNVTGREQFAIVKGLTPEQSKAANTNSAYLNEALDYRAKEQVGAYQPTPDTGQADPISQVVREMLENSQRSMDIDPQTARQIEKITARTEKMETAPSAEEALTEAQALDTEVNDLLKSYPLDERDMEALKLPDSHLDAASYTKALKQTFACMVA